MYPLIIVISLIAITTFATGLLLPLSQRRTGGTHGLSQEERYAAELAAGR